MKLLDPRERRILSLRFYEGKTQMEVSAEVGISQAQVSRLEEGRHQHHPQALIGEKPPERCSGGQFCIPPRGCKRNGTVFEHFLLFSFDLFCQSV